jgi:hypothetical protein
MPFLSPNGIAESAGSQRARAVGTMIIRGVPLRPLFQPYRPLQYGSFLLPSMRAFAAMAGTGAVPASHRRARLHIQ